jgi:hypothetical protein
MTATMDTPAARAPWHLWVVGIVGVLWNGFGAFDYTMTNLQGDAWLQQAGMTQQQIDYFHAMPSWMMAVWAVGVWGGLLGAILLLVRRKLALPVFVASLAAYVLSLIYYYVLTDGLAAMGQSMLPMNIAILVGCLFFVWYAWTMTKRGVLR